MAKTVITDVTDTARWVAVYRAQESARSDALFHDPLADRLAGERGRIIATAAKRSFGNGWYFIARTKLIDNLIMECLADGCDRVVNLAAGLDTRPYRLDLPPTLEWIEVDLPVIIEEKNRMLADESPRCRLSRVTTDLTEESARQSCLMEATQGASKALVITEGLLLYLQEPEVRALMKDLSRPEVTWWITDVIGPAVVRMSARASKLNNAAVTFGPANGIAFFEQAGWSVEKASSQLAAAADWNRLSPFLRLLARLPSPNPRRPGRVPWSAVVRLRH